MGTVHLVQSAAAATAIGPPCALKFLQAGMTSDTRIAAFKREFALLADLHHPHVCRVFDFGYSTSHQQYFFTAEFVEGEGLYRAMRQASLEEIEVVILQMLSALDFIHTLGLIHFDVKGANILVSRRSGGLHATLVDFGVTVFKEDALKEIAGTLFYMAPELLYPNPRVDQRVDLYSFGVVCYHLLAGTYPYEVHSVDAARAWHLTQHVDFAPLRERGIPEYLCQLVERLLAANPAERFSSAGVAANFLRMHSTTAQAYALTAIRAHQAEGPLIGRETLLDACRNALQRGRKIAQPTPRSGEPDTQPLLHWISGGRGFGKSRLLKEIKQEAQVLDFATWQVDCEHAGQDVPHLAHALHITPSADDPLTADFCCQQLLERSRTTPVCLLINNLDRAAPAVAKLLAQLCGQLYSAALQHTPYPLTLFCTIMADAPLAMPSGVQRCDLEPLTRDHVYTYLETLLGASDDLPTFHEAVWQFSHGVPLLMVEAAKRFRAGSDTAQLPASIEQLYEEQIAAVSPAAHDALLTLALLAEPVDAATLMSILQTEDTVTLAPLLAQQLIRADAGEPVRFRPITGALTETLLRITPHATQQRIGAAVVDWALAQSPPHTTYAAQCARFASAPESIAELLLDAAAQAERGGAVDHAMQHLDTLRQLFATRADPQHIWARATRKLSTLAIYQGQYQTCETLLTDIAAREGTASVDDLKMRGLAKRAQRQPKDAIPLYDDALAQLAGAPEGTTSVFLRNERAQALFEAGRTDDALAAYQDAQQHWRTLTPDAQRGVTNNNLGALLARLGRFDEACAFYHDKLLQVAHDKRLTASVHAQLGHVYQQIGDAAQSLAHYEQAWQFSRAAGSTHNAHAILEQLVTGYTQRAEYSRALHYAQASLQLRAGQTAAQELATSLKTLASLYLQLGLPDVAARYLTHAMRIARKCRSHQLTGWIQILFGYLYKDLGRLMESLNAYEEAIALGQEHDEQALVEWGYYGATDLLVEHGELAEATQYFERLARTGTQHTTAEFQTRVQLLAHKLSVIKHPLPDATLGTALHALIQACADSAWHELQWEAEHLLGIFHHKRDELPDALHHMRTARQIITTLADHLSEEYRDPFRRQRARARVAADLRTLQRMDTCDSGNTIATTESSNDTTVGDCSASATPQATAVIERPSTDTAAPQRTVAMDVPPESPADTTVIRFRPDATLAHYERHIIELALTAHQGNLAVVAQTLDIPIVALLEKMQLHGLG